MDNRNDDLSTHAPQTGDASGKAGPPSASRGIRPPALALAALALAIAVVAAAAFQRSRSVVSPEGSVASEAAAPVVPHTPKTYFVSPQGRPDDPGTREAPMALAVALSAAGPVRPGDTVWMLGGVYTGPFKSDLRGTPEAPIIVRQYLNERAIIDSTTGSGSALYVTGAHTWYWGFEVRSSESTRISKAEFAVDIQRGAGVTSHAPGAKFINLVVHDMKNGLEVWSSSPDAEVYGNLIYHNGYAAVDRGHGHGIYAQNQTGVQWFTDNILFGGFSHGIHAYGSDAAFLNNIRLEGNIIFNSGILSPYFERNILVGGGRLAENPVVNHNYTYYSNDRRGGENNIGYAAGCTNLQARGNYWAHPRQYPVVIRDNCNGEVRGNVMIGAFSDEAQARFPENSFRGSAPAGLDIFVRPNRYEPGRAHIVVYNWDNYKAVAVNLAATGLRKGVSYEIRDAQNFFGPPIAAGTYDASNDVQIPMDGVTAVTPLGGVPLVPGHTGREFGAFIVIPRS